MDTHYLEAFLLVADVGSMSEAARRLDLSPAAIAQQIRVLEREFGAELLMRSGRTVMPTECGARLVERARMLIRDLNTIKESVNEKTVGSELRIGTINTALHSVLPDVLSGFSRRFPNLKITIKSAMSGELYDALLRSDIDVAVCLHPTFRLPKTLGWELLREEPLTVLVPQRWSKRDPHELLSEAPFIRYDKTLGGGKQADRYLRQAKIVPNERFELSSLAAIAMLVDRGLGVTLIPDATSPWWPGLKVSKLRLPQDSGSRRFGIIWERASVQVSLIKCLAEEGRKVVNKY